MAILIKGMEMPKTCDECDFHIYHSDGEYICVATPLLYPWNLANYKGGRKDFCPLVEVDSDNLVDADRVIHTQVYDDEHEEVIDRSMTIADFLDEYTEEGCPMSVMDVEE